MSEEPKKDLPDLSPDSRALPNQAERDAQRAEIIHPDGTREEVEIRSERFW